MGGDDYGGRTAGEEDGWGGGPFPPPTPGHAALVNLA